MISNHLLSLLVCPEISTSTYPPALGMGRLKNGLTQLYPGKRLLDARTHLKVNICDSGDAAKRTQLPFSRDLIKKVGKHQISCASMVSASRGHSPEILGKRVPAARWT